MSSTYYQDALAVKSDLVQFMQDIIRIPSLSSEEGAVIERIRDEMLRIGRQCIVTFPNFGHWRCRLYLGTRGRMPVSRFMPHMWYDTPNIHFCTVKDFEALCALKGIRILARDVVGNTERTPVLAGTWPNLFATTAIYRITR